MFSLILSLLFILRTRFANKPILNIVRDRYGEDGVRCFRELEQSDFKIRKNQCDIEFLDFCLNNELFPKFLQFKLSIDRFQNDSDYKAYQRKLLSKEAEEKFSCMKALQERKDQAVLNLKRTCSFLDLMHFSSYIETGNVKKQVKLRMNHDRKLFKLGVSRSFDQLSPDKLIFNLSDKVLTDEQKQILCLGLKYCLRPLKINFSDYFLAFENLFKQRHRNKIHECFPNALAYIKSSIKTIAYKYYYSFKAHPTPREKRHLEVLKELSSDKSVVVTRPDKGSGVVILNRSDYVKKMELILNDSSKFTKTDTDMFKIALKYEDKTNRFIDKIYKLNIIDQDTKTKLRISGSTPGVMYGLPKVHKKDAPLRPILSSIGTHNYKLSKYLVNLLSPLVDCTYSLTDSFQFASEISNFSHSGCVMASFDVKSLFSNIPVKETCDLILNKIFPNDNVKYCGYDKNIFRTLLELCCTDNFFLFDNLLYVQKDGAPMGGCVSPTLANFFLGYYEKIWLENCPNEFKPFYYKRYVDDTFLLFKNQNHVSLFLEYVNSRHPSISFTCEVETNNQLPFLDTIVRKLEDSFETGLYRKPTHTGLGLKYNSFISKTYKLNLIGCLIDRAYKLCSTSLAFAEEMDFLKKYFYQNGFPIKLVNSKFKNKLSTLTKTKMISPTVSKLKLFSCVPYLDKESNAGIHSEIQELVAKFYPQIELCIIFKNRNTIGSFFNFKDRIPDLMRSNVVYKYSCAHCDATYYGETTRHLSTRIAEHRGLSVRTGMPVLNPLNSSIRDHAIFSNHGISTNSFSIVFSCNSYNLKTSESIIISQNKPSLNNTESSVPLNVLT